MAERDDGWYVARISQADATQGSGGVEDFQLQIFVSMKNRPCTLLPRYITSSFFLARRKPNWPIEMLRMRGSWTSRSMRAVSEYILARASIFSAISYLFFGDVLTMPFVTKPSKREKAMFFGIPIQERNRLE